MTTSKPPANQVAMTIEGNQPSAAHEPSTRTLRGLDGLNFFLADVQTGVGPFLGHLPCGL